MNNFKYFVGIDPGWKNLGYAIIKANVDTGELLLVKSGVMNPSSYRTIPEFIKDLDLIMKEFIGSIHSVAIERFVAYAGISTAETENICYVIGALQLYFGAKEPCGVEPLMLRAIDWKIPLAKALHVKKGFENPSPKLDKKFSDAAANACLGLTKNLETNHESDAVCLACFRSITNKGK